MKWKNYLLLAVFCALVAVSSSVTVHAQRDYVPVDDRYYDVISKNIFTIEEKQSVARWGTTGWVYVSLFGKKIIPLTIVGIPMDQKDRSAVPAKDRRKNRWQRFRLCMVY